MFYQKIHYLALVLLLFALFSGPPDQVLAEGHPPKRATPPNIVYILADDMGWGDLSVLGQRSFSTPNIDRLARQGMLFSNHYAGSAVCAPSRASLMTGLHTGHSPIRGHKALPGVGVVPLEDRYVTLPEAIKVNTSYVTGMSGRWHLGGELTKQTPYDRGFDYHFGKLSSDYPNRVGQMIDDLWDAQGHHLPYAGYKAINTEPMYLNGRLFDLTSADLKTRPIIMDKIVTTKAMEFLEANQAKPFFLYVAYALPHDPMEYHAEFPVKNDILPEKEKAFVSMMQALDGYVGRLLTKLDELELSENTVVIFTSDNGAHHEGGHDHAYFKSNGPFREYKRSFYDGGMHSPMIVRWPGKVKAESRSDHLSAFYDVLPTVCEIAGAPIQQRTDGISFLPELLGQKQPQHDYLYWEFNESIDFKKNQYKQAVRMGRWKGIFTILKDKFELYDLDKDVGERKNVADQYPAVVARIREIMKKAHEPSSTFPLTKSELAAAGITPE
ncbi:arylsulfatase [Telluribacter sp.]|jgi:arylsulfatase A-like enzyme|uniref:arylsulfatase n=1 Tax=Telluribacter sp. TaxID=1978767 RepID=UPI002E14563B|nr:arylsulfatase [Telluribacter sp.]